MHGQCRGLQHCYLCWAGLCGIRELLQWLYMLTLREDVSRGCQSRHRGELHLRVAVRVRALSQWLLHKDLRGNGGVWLGELLPSGSAWVHLRSVLLRQRGLRRVWRERHLSEVH